MGAQTALHHFVHHFLLHLLVPHLPFVLDVAVVLVDLLVLEVDLLLCGFEVVLLHLLVQLLDLLVPESVLLGLLALLPQLQVQRVHHLLLEVLRLLLVLPLRLHSDLQVVARIVVIHPRRSRCLLLEHIFLLDVAAFEKASVFLKLLPVARGFGLLGQLLVVESVLILFSEFCIAATVELVVQLSSA